MSRIRIGVVGCGQWGPNQLRTFYFHPETEVVRICDQDASRLEANRALFRTVQTTSRYQDVTEAADIDAVIITTPVFSHFEIAQSALLHGKDVLCEKPLTVRFEDSRLLAELAHQRSRILLVGHVFVFNSGIVKLKDLIQKEELGRKFYLYATHTNLGPVRHDVNAVYDLASHDIAIFNFLLDAKPRVLSATGKCYLQPRVEDVAFLSLEYPGNILAHIHVSWLDPKKIREITVVGEQKMLIWNDLKLSGPIEIYSKHVERRQFYSDYGEFQLLVKDGEILVPSVRSSEPLKQQADHFVKCIRSREKPLSDGRFACDVVKTLEEIEALLEAERA